MAAADAGYIRMASERRSPTSLMAGRYDERDGEPHARYAPPSRLGASYAAVYQPKAPKIISDPFKRPGASPSGPALLSRRSGSTISRRRRGAAGSPRHRDGRRPVDDVAALAASAWRRSELDVAWTRLHLEAQLDGEVDTEAEER